MEKMWGIMSILVCHVVVQTFVSAIESVSGGHSCPPERIRVCSNATTRSLDGRQECKNVCPTGLRCFGGPQHEILWCFCDEGGCVMPDDLKIRLAVIALLCLLPTAAVVVAIIHARRRGRRSRGGRGFGVIVKR